MANRKQNDTPSPSGAVERKAGEHVTWCSRRLYVTEQTGRGCGGCVFWCTQAGRFGECEFDGMQRPAELGECRAQRRTDGQNVWYVTQEEYEQLRAAQRKKRDEDRAFRKFTQGFASSRLGRAAAAEMRKKKEESKSKN